MNSNHSRVKDKESAMGFFKGTGEQSVQEIKTRIDAVVTQAQQAKQEVLDSVNEAQQRVKAARQQVEEQAEQRKQDAAWIE